MNKTILAPLHLQFTDLRNDHVQKTFRNDLVTVIGSDRENSNSQREL